MPNNPKADLIYAILAMDAYNRGYGSGISDLGEQNVVSNWSILTTSTDQLQQSAFNAGFYAIAYDVSAVSGITGSNTVIAYRGTTCARGVI